MGAHEADEPVALVNELGLLYMLVHGASVLPALRSVMPAVLFLPIVSLRVAVQVVLSV